MYEIVFGGDIMNEAWPKYDEKYLMEDEIEIPIQVNGKLRAKVKVSKSASEDEVKAKAVEAVKDFVANGIKKIIYIPGRIFNIVV